MTKTEAQDRAARRARRGVVHRLAGFRRDQRGATAIEYGLIVAGLAAFVVTAVSAGGTNISLVMNKVSNGLK